MFYSASTKGFYTPAIHGMNIPNDAVEITDEYYHELLAGQSRGKKIVFDAVAGKPVLIDRPPMTFEQAMRFYDSAVQNRLDTFAATKGYSGISSAVSYAASTNEAFAADGARAIVLRDETWTAFYSIMNDAQQSGNVMPTLDEVIAQLPTLEW